MKLKIFILLCSTAVIFSCNKDEISEKQADTFIKFFADGDMMIEGADIKQASDGGYVILGTGTYNVEGSANEGTSDIYLAKTDKFGQLESWSPVMIGGDFNEVGNRLEILDDGYLIFGDADDTGDGNFDMYLLKTNLLGSVTWEHTYGDNLNNHGSDVQVLDDGGFVLAGYYTRLYIDPVSFEEKSTIDPFILETDASGVQVGVDYNAGEDVFHEIPVAIQPTASGYLVIGQKIDVATDESDLWMLLLPNLGYASPILGVPVADGRDDYGVDLAITDDDRIFFLANREQASGRLEALVGEVNVSTLRVISTFDPYIESNADLVVNDIKYSPDNSFVVTGGKRIAGSSDMLFLKVDLNGVQMKRHFYGESGSQTGNAVCYTSDGGYIIVGTNAFEGVLSMIALVKTGPDGTLN
jgi:hypothetical protein